MYRKTLGTLSLFAALTLVAACGGSSDTQPAETPKPSAPAETKSQPAAQPSGAPGATGSASISGKIKYEGDVPKLRPLQMDADPGCAKKHTEEVMPEVLVLGDGNALANVMVYVKGISGSYPVPSEPVTLDQHGCQYLPHVATVQTGQTFEILNSDGLLHNVHGLPEKNTSFNRAMPAAVTKADYTFDKPEIFKVKCDVHPWMGAWVGVFTHPFHAVTGTDGTFTVSGLPAGSYEVEAWHEKLGTMTAQVTVADGETGTSDFTFVK